MRLARPQLILAIALFVASDLIALVILLPHFLNGDSEPPPPQSAQPSQPSPPPPAAPKAQAPTGPQDANAQACIENLKQITLAKRAYMKATGAERGTEITEADLVGPDLYLKEMPTCPSGGTYTLLKIGKRPVCSHPGHVLAKGDSPEE